MHSLISPEKHFQSREIQSLIAGNFGCSAITNEGSSCKPTLTTNKFKDQFKHKWDCNFYCMRKCTPKLLIHLFEKTPKSVNMTKGSYPVVYIYI